MKLSLKTFLPALIVTMIALGLIGCFYLRIHVLHTGFVHLKGNDTIESILNLLVKGAILLGAGSFSWFIFKKNLKASPKFIKAVGKKVYNLHSFFGWAALILVVLHGGYYLLTEFSNRHNLTGLAAFITLAAIVVYGLFIKRSKKKSIKQVHFMLTMVWLVALLIHGGSFVILACGLLLGLFIVLSLLKTREKEKDLKVRRVM